MTLCLPMQSLMPPITPTPLEVPLRSVCGFVDPSAIFQWGYVGADGWSAADKQLFSSKFLHFRKLSMQPRQITINPVRNHFPSLFLLPAALRTRCVRLLTLCSRPAALRTRCSRINILGKSFVLLFCNAADSNSPLPILLFLFSDPFSSSKRNNGIFNSPIYGWGG